MIKCFRLAKTRHSFDQPLGFTLYKNYLQWVKCLSPSETILLYRAAGAVCISGEKLCPFIFILSICVHLIAEQKICGRVLYTHFYTSQSRTGLFMRSSHQMRETNSQSGGDVLVYLSVSQYISPELLLFVVASCCLYYKYCAVIFLFLLWQTNNNLFYSSLLDYDTMSINAVI